MAQRARLGGKIRRLRGEAGLTQVELAKRLGISASYINLIEHNQRPLTVPLLLKLSGILEVDLQMLSEDEEGRILADLDEVLGDPLFADLGIGQQEMGELASLAPAACQAIVTCYRAYRRARDDVQALGERLSEDPFLSASVHQLRTLLTSVRSFSEILHDNVDLAAAERQRYLAIVVGESAQLTQTVNDLLGFISAEGMDRLLGARSPADEVADFLQARGNYFDDLEAAADKLRAEAGGVSGFGAALRLAEGTGDELFADFLGDATLSSETTRRMCREALAKYVAAAVLMPYGGFLAAAQEVRYDIELLQRRFGVSFEQACQRLTTLQRPGARAIPFHFLRVDIAGNLSKRFSASGLRIPRYGGVCPRWNVHQAFLAPGRIDTQIAEMPDGTAYFCIARAEAKPAPRHGAPVSHYSIAIGCELAYAGQFVYADGLDLAGGAAPVPVGASCRVCERAGCDQRALPSLIQESAEAAAAG